MKKVSASAQLAPDTHCLRWQTSKCPFTIEYAPDVLEEIRQAAMDAFFSVPHGGAEIGGVLFGIREPGCVRILAARPLQCDYANGPTFTLSERDHQRLQLLLASQEFHNQGWVPLGWYHSHTRSELLLSVR